MKKETVELGGEKFKIKKGALHKQLKVPQSYKFNRTELNKINKTELGKSFDFNGKSFKMTNLMRDRVTLALNLMRRK